MLLHAGETLIVLGCEPDFIFVSIEGGILAVLSWVGTF